MKKTSREDGPVRKLKALGRYGCGLVLLLAAGLAAAQAPPTWPQTFVLDGPAPRTFRIPVTQPGAVSVDIQAQGAAVTSALVGVLGPAAQQQGTGALHLAYNVTAADVQKSPFWAVSVQLLQATVQGQKANVTMNVQLPPTDAARLKQILDDGVARLRAAQPQIDAANAQRVAQLNQSVASLNQQFHAKALQDDAQRRAGLLAQIQPALDQMRGRATIGTRDLPQMTIQRLQKVAPPPTIQSLSLTAIHMNDPIMITGSGFGTTAGTVHFVLAPGKDFAADTNGMVWTDSQIFATVPGPAAGGLTDFSGVAYVVRPDQVKSNLISVAFHATLDQRLIVITSLPTDSTFTFGTKPQPPGISRHDGDFSGMTGTDRIYPNTHLKNGWKVSGAPQMTTTISDGGSGNAIPVGFLPGTDWPTVSVIWWVNPGLDYSLYWHSDYGYSFVLPISGPLGLADGIVQMQ